MLTVTGELADMVNMICDMCQYNLLIILRPKSPTGTDHPVIKCGADHPVPREDSANLLVIELALVRHQRTAIIMAGEHNAMKPVHCLPKCLIGEMGQIKDYVLSFH